MVCYRCQLPESLVQLGFVVHRIEQNWPGDPVSGLNDGELLKCNQDQKNLQILSYGSGRRLSQLCSAPFSPTVLIHTTHHIFSLDDGQLRIWKYSLQTLWTMDCICVSVATCANQHKLVVNYWILDLTNLVHVTGIVNIWGILFSFVYIH
ncbi:hypothetical protein XENOCAPTIV_017908 [Xenoophorus captivus]|uniref:Uncharacterized protein n=1 Tax=Xenoophorus captivus TaxID=1517983 RepID=A0ABV0S2L5_9TELE